MKRIRAEDGAKDEKFIEGDPRTSQEPTRVRAYWLNAVQEEIANAIEKNGAPLDQTKNDQLYSSIKKSSSYDVIVDRPEDLRKVIEEAKDNTSIFVRSFDWTMETSPIRLTASQVLVEFSPGTRLTGKKEVNGGDGLKDGEGIVEISGENCTILGGLWDFSDNPQNKYHAVKFTKPDTAIKPYFGLSRIKGGLLNSTTIPPSAILTF